jgi:hypothetical protein
MSSQHQDARPTIEAIVAESRTRQGLPERVTDPTALRTIAALLVTRDDPTRPAKRTRKARPAA